MCDCGRNNYSSLLLNNVTLWIQGLDGLNSHGLKPRKCWGREFESRSPHELLSPALLRYDAVLWWSEPWRWRQHGPLKLWYPTTTLHGLTTQKTLTWIFTAVKTSALALCTSVHIFKIRLCFPVMADRFPTQCCWTVLNFSRPVKWERRRECQIQTADHVIKFISLVIVMRCHTYTRTHIIHPICLTNCGAHTSQWVQQSTNSVKPSSW
jgi:hypothetical protein